MSGGRGRMKRFSKVLLVLCAVAICAIGGMWGTRYFFAEGEAAEGTSGPSAVRVGLARPETRRIERDVTAVGTLSPVRYVDIVPSVSGRVTKVPVSSGQRVAEGDLLIQLDDRAAQASLEEAEATLEEARQDFRRFEDLATRDTVADAQLEAARAAFRRAEAVVAGARSDLEDRAIRAPFGGTLGVIDTEPGAVLDGSEVVTRLSDLSVMELRASIPERYYSEVSPGQTVRITVPAYPDETFEGEVTVRAPQIEQASRSFDIRAEIANPDRRLAGGMFANTALILDTYEGLAVPDDAIISEGFTTYVYLATDDDTARRAEIVTGASLGEVTEVREGLSEEDRVVVAGWDDLSDGDEVRIDEDFEGGALE